MKQWAEGVYLLGTFEFFQTGCWMLVNGKEAAIVEFPPYTPGFNESPADLTKKVTEELGLTIKYLLCTHTHHDHYSTRTMREFQNLFPDAEFYLQTGFKNEVRLPNKNVHFFDEQQVLFLEQEPLILEHAPKHSMTDTMIIFKGSVCTGDWELNTLISCHDDKPRYAVKKDVKIRSIEKMALFQSKYHYWIHTIYSAHANDFRKDIDFTALMQSTLSPSLPY
ncbi:MAG: MBL fold metallo-hydrolase [Candidatus Kapabacteria bacterium]|nr:MBL fold metallo-hydrolase [Candidatus Kapabacteria bacterium]